MVKNPDLDRGLRELLAVQDFLERCEMYREGVSPEIFPSVRWRDLLNANPELYRLSYSGVPIRVINNRLKLSAFTVPDDAKLTDRVMEIWRENKLHLTSRSFHQDVLTYGTSYASCWPDDKLQPRIRFESPTTTRVVFNAAGDPEFAVKAWKERINNEWTVRANLYYPDRLEKYQGSSEFLASADWYPLEVINNPLGQIPIIAFATQWPVGAPEHAAVWGVQDALTKLIVTDMAAVDGLGLPIRVVLMDPLSPEGTGGLGGLDELAGANEPPTSTTDTSERLSARPGDLLALRAKGIDEFSAAKADEILKRQQHYIAQLSLLSDIPHRFYADAGDDQHPAANSLSAQDAPLRERVTAREESMGYSYGELMRLALLIDGNDVPEVLTHWQPPEITVNKDTWEAAQIRIQMGEPPYSVYKSMGFPESTLISWGLNEAAARWQPPAPPQSSSGTPQ